MKTVKVSDELYDKVNAIAAKSGGSLTEAANTTLTAGLGELKQLGDDLKATLSNEDIVIKGKKGKPKAAENPGETITKSEVEGNEVEGNEGEAEEGNGWLWFVGLVVAALALAQRAESIREKASIFRG